MPTDGSRNDLAKRRWAGAFALLAFAYAAAWPFVRDALPPIFGSPARVQPRKAASEPRPDVSTVMARAKSASEKLEGAADKAIRARATRPSTDAQHDSEDVDTRTKETATACVISLLPEGTLGEDPDLGWMCDETELWVVNRYLYDRITTRGRGPGVQQWVRQGRFNLAAVALLRARCCPEGEVFSAVQATSHCDSLGAVLDRIIEDPSPEHVDRYATTVECLMERKVWVPQSWSRVKRKIARKQFDEFLASLP